MPAGWKGGVVEDEEKNDEMLVRRAATGSDLGIVCFQSMENLVFVFILI